MVEIEATKKDKLAASMKMKKRKKRICCKCCYKEESLSLSSSATKLEKSPSGKLINTADGDALMLSPSNSEKQLSVKKGDKNLSI
jgi:hypothetical protein